MGEQAGIEISNWEGELAMDNFSLTPGVVPWEQGTPASLLGLQNIYPNDEILFGEHHESIEQSTANPFSIPHEVVWNQWLPADQPGYPGSFTPTNDTGLVYWRNGAGRAGLSSNSYVTSTYPQNNLSPTAEDTGPPSCESPFLDESPGAIPNRYIQQPLPEDHYRTPRHLSGNAPNYPSPELTRPKDDFEAHPSSSTRQHTRGRKSSNSNIKRTRERNRSASMKCRAQKKKNDTKLESTREDAEQDNSYLSNCVADLRLEVYHLKMQLLQHADCDCPQIQEYILNQAKSFVKGIEEGSQDETSHASVSGSTPIPTSRTLTTGITEHDKT